MSRKLKYGEPTKTVGFKVPLSKEKDVRKLVNDYLNPIIKVSVDFGNGNSVLMVESFETGMKMFGIKDCGCIIENGLLKRGKNSKCKLTKSEH